MRKTKQFLCAALAAVMLVGACCVPTSTPLLTEAAEQTTTQPANPVYDAATDSTDWDFVYFGSYPQTELKGDALTEEITSAKYDRRGEAMINGEKYRKISISRATYVAEDISSAFYDWTDKKFIYFKYEPIRWRVLQNDGTSLFLMADIALDTQKYHTSKDRISWKDCSLRTWLNGEEAGQFYGTAFSDEEKAAILTSKVSNKPNPFHGTTSGSDTEDKVYLPSIEEMITPAYGFPEAYMTYSKTRRMYSSDYARAMGAWIGSYTDQYYGNSWYMLRSTGNYEQQIALVYPFGNVYMDGYYVNTPYYCVCPVLKVDINSKAWTQLSEEETAARNAWLKESPADERVETAKIVYGDVDGDGAVTMTDARKVLRTALAIDTLETDAQRIAANVDGDDSGAVGLTDAQLVLERALKLTAYFPEVETDPTDDQATLLKVPASGGLWPAADSIAEPHLGKSGYDQPIYGWEEVIEDYFNDSFKLHKSGLSSRSSKSYTTESKYYEIMEKMTAGDYVVISFGHNDERPDVKLYTNPYGSSDEEGSFKWYLKNYYVDPVLKRGGQPVFLTPVARRYFYQGKFVNPQLHTPYAQAMKELVEEYKQKGVTIYCVDAHSKFLALYEELGEDGTLAYHGIYKGNTGYDNTHLSEKGVRQTMEWLTQGLKEQGAPLADFVK